MRIASGGLSADLCPAACTGSAATTHLTTISARSRAIAVALACAALASTLAGCVHRGPYPGSSYVAGPQQIAHMPVPPRRAVEMEDDGLPVQRPPMRRAIREQDDPREPWSPNYGKQPAPPATSSDPQPKAAPRQASDTGKPTLNATPVKFDADALIAKAIAAHEVYNQ